MKRILILLAVVLGLQLPITAQDNPEANKKYPVMKFDTVSYDLGTLNEGDVVTKVYRFKNTGDAPLIISKIRASCGCTVPSGWKKEPIMPGESSEFTVRFNSKHKIHKQYKTITVYCNTKKGTERVYFTANVIPDPEMEKQRAERRRMYAERRKKQQAAKLKAKKPVVKKIPKNTPAYEKAQKELKAQEKKLKKIKKRLQRERKKMEKKRKAFNQAQKKVNTLQKKRNELQAKAKRLKMQL